MYSRGGEKIMTVKIYSQWKALSRVREKQAKVISPMECRIVVTWRKEGDSNVGKEHKTSEGQ